MTSGQLRIKVTSQRHVLSHHGSHNVGFKVSPGVPLPAAQESGESFRELHVLQHLPLDFGHKLARRFANREPATGQTAITAWTRIRVTPVAAAISTLSLVSTPVERLIRRLDLEQGETGEATTTWHGEVGENALNLSNRLFGGFVVAQSIMAAGKTHDDRDVHSIQQVFLRGGNATEPLRYRVERLFTGRTYASVRVEVHQGDHIISHAQVGVTAGSAGPDRQDAAPVIPDRSGMANRDELQARANWDDQPVEMFIDPDGEGDGKPSMPVWMRPVGPLPADQLIHKAVLGFATDRGLMTVALRPHREHGNFKGATLDHAIWFHRPLQFDDWHSYDMHSPTIAGGRGLSQGAIHHHDGTLVATTVQQGTFRPI